MSRIRHAAFAGRFYPADQAECTRMLEQMTRPVEISGRPVGAIVPHAGWVYSGPTAALSIAALAQVQPETIVVFGAVHRADLNHASLYPSGSWETPLGLLHIDEDLANRFARNDQITPDPGAHAHEHSIEVQLPLIQHLVGDVTIVPIGVRPSELAAEIGRICSAEAADSGRSVVFLGSTDLTHYGPAFGFEPHGHGEAGVRWAKDVNDRRFVDLIARLDAEGVVPEAAMSHNACGSGATAAAIAAARAAGAESYVELEHTASADLELGQGGRPTSSVGYEAGVFTRPA